jgi:hypothetical protein
MFLRRDVLKKNLVTGDVDPSQSTLPTVDASILAHGGACATRYAARVAASRTGTHGTRVSDVAVVVLPMNETATAIQTPSRRSLNNNQPSRTPGPHIQGLAPSVRTFLTRVSGNEAWDCPHSESDDEEEDPSQGFYTNTLFSDEPLTHRARTDDDEDPVIDNEEYIDISVPPSGLANEKVDIHNGLYWQRDGVLEEPQIKMPFSRGRLKPKYVKNSATPLDSIMSIFPLIYWKVIARESNDNAQMKLNLQFLKNGKRTISGCRWTHETTYTEILQFYGILMMIVLFPLPRETCTAYWTYASPMFTWTNMMTLSRFKQLRSVLHFNSNLTKEKGNDALHKT